ncbi:GNAT family N-acetyltransferase [Echinicola soli]|nr:GNAT family N-acetyltransferase [Echinicola soli]
MKNNYQIIPIRPEDTWDLRHRVMWPDQPIDYVKLEEDHHGQHFGLIQEDKLITVISVFIKDDQAQFRKFATEISLQGKGLGSILLQHAISRLEKEGIHRIWCNARADKTAFYEKFGFQRTLQTFVKGGIDYVIMEKTTVQISENRNFTIEDLLPLYQKNQWSSANMPDVLYNGLTHSDSLVTAWENDQLVGLGNAISDGYLVVYFPHLLVLPSHQCKGIGRKIMERMLEKYAGFHMQMLTAEVDAVSFYEKIGFEHAGKTVPMWKYEGKEH